MGPKSKVLTSFKRSFAGQQVEPQLHRDNHQSGNICNLRYIVEKQLS